MNRVTRLNRREFLELTGVAAGGLLLGVKPLTAAEAAAGATFQPNVFISLDASGTVTLVAHRSEMGQGSRSGLPAVLADEMEALWERVRVVQADGDPKYGNQNTDGSRSVRTLFEPMRQAGATARLLLERAAAATWEVEASECRASEHRVVHRPSGRSLGFGELAARAAGLPMPDPSELKLKPRSEWRYIGKPMPIVDLDDMVTGRAVYGIDVELPEMLHGAIERCPVVGGKVASFDATAAMKVPGVVRVVELPAAGTSPGFQPLGGVAVLADNTWAAARGRRALEVEWDPGSNAAYDSSAFRRQLESTAAQPGIRVRERGDVDAALAAAAKVVEAAYYTPHLSQSPMEPPCATADFRDGRCEVWAPTQSPQSARGEIARALGIEPEAVTVHVTLLGGGFGRKSKPDFAVEAALLSREAGRPVKVTWSREDDVRHGYYHSVSCQHLKAGLDDNGRVTAWLHRSVFPSIGATFQPGVNRAGAGELGLGLVDAPYDVANLCCENGEATAHVRIGWLRSVANIYHAFGAGCFADELARAVGADPKEFLLELIGEPRTFDPAGEGAEYSNYGQPLADYPIDTGRLRGVIELAAEKAGWGKKLPQGRGMGIAAHRSFLAYVAAVVEVSVTGADVRVEEVHCAIDCGTVVNPDRVRAQMEGSVIFGLGAALHGEITAREGAIRQSNFHDYKILRIDETPRVIGTWLVESNAPPAGVGEPGVPPVAPALANAIHAASGRRVRELPLLAALAA